MRRWAAGLLVVAAVGCGIPRDPEGTLERVRGATLRAGFAVEEPWTALEDGQPAGVEVELVEAFARQLDASVEWTQGSQAELVEALEVGALDLVVGGFTADSPYAGSVGMTRPYVTTRTVVGVPADLVGGDIAGLRVAVTAGGVDQGLLAKTDAVPVPADDVASSDGPAVVDDWALDDLGLHDSGVVLAESQHVMAVRLGENATLVALERFLSAQRDALTARLRREGPA